MTSPIQQLGRVSREYELRANEYQGIALDAAQAEADYRREHAVCKLRAMAEGASAAKADAVADADDVVSASCLGYKSAAALCDAAGKKLIQLREQIAVGRSVLVGEREADKLAAAGTSGGA